MSEANPQNITVSGDNRGVVINASHAKVRVRSSRRLKQAKRVWSVPFPQDPNFRGREDELAELAEAVRAHKRSVVTETIAGMGGIGKTQLAVHLAHRLKSEFSIVWWIDAERPESIAHSLAALGQVLEPTPEPSLTSTLSMLATRHSGRWLLIYDNVESPETLERMLPTSGTGSVLITTRSSVWPAWADVMALAPLREADSVALIGARSTDDLEAARRIASLLGNLPLALAQAAAQARSGVSLGEYERLIRERTETTLNAPISGRGGQGSVWEIIALSIQSAADLDPAAGELLHALALFNPDHVEDWLLTRFPESSALASPLTRAAARSALERFSLATRCEVPALPSEGMVRARSEPGRTVVNPQGTGLTVHRVVRDVARASFPEEAAVGRALETLDRALLEAEPFDRDRIGLAVTAHLRAFLDRAEILAPVATVGLLRRIARINPNGFDSEGIGAWAARAALAIVEREPHFTEQDTVEVLLEVHAAESTELTAKGTDLAPIRRALSVQRRLDPEGSAEVARLNLRLAAALAGQYSWQVTLTFPADDLMEAESVATSAINLLTVYPIALDEWHEDSLPDALVLRGGTVGHLGRLDEASADFMLAISLAEEELDDLWLGRAAVAELLLKFNRAQEARVILEPLVPRLIEQGGAIGFRGRNALSALTKSLEQQSDWPRLYDIARARLDRADQGHRIGTMPDDEITISLLLRDMVTWLDRMELSEPAQALRDRIERDQLLKIHSRLEAYAGTPLTPFATIDNAVASFEQIDDGGNTGRRPILMRHTFQDLPSLGERGDLRLRLARLEMRRLGRVGGRRPVAGRRALVDPGFTTRVELACALADTRPRKANRALARALRWAHSHGLDLPDTDRCRLYLQFIEAGHGTAHRIIDAVAAMASNWETLDGHHSINGGCTAPTIIGAAAAAVAGRDPQQAIDLYLVAASLEEAVHGHTSENVAMFLYNAGDIGVEQNDPSTRGTGCAHLQDSLTIAAACFGDRCPRWAVRAIALAEGRIGTEPDAAVDLAQRARDVFCSHFGPDHSLTARCDRLLSGTQRG